MPLHKKRFLTAEWRWLAMLNYPVDPELLAPLVPAGTSLDFHDGETYISVVGFQFWNTKLLGLPVPWHRNFEEVNLRFYVKREVAGELRRGVVFLKELAPKWAIVTIANAAYHEQYELRRMRHAVDTSGPAPAVQYEWQVDQRWNGISAQAKGEAHPLGSESLEEFIAEHYWGYTKRRDGRTVEYRVEHPPWKVWQVEQAQLDCDIEQVYGAHLVPILEAPPHSAFIADGSEIAVYRPVTFTAT